MDITTLFKACVKTIRTRNKAFGLNGEVEKTKLFKTPTKRTEFMLKAKEVLGQITRLRDFIFEHRKAYLNFASHLSDVPQMSDVERDKIDSGAQRIMNTCSHLIKEFKRESDKLAEPQQLKEHHKAVIELVESYLKVVCKIYSEQRAIRVKRAVELQKLSKLDLGKRKAEAAMLSSGKLCKTSNEDEENGDPKGNSTKEDLKRLDERGGSGDDNPSHYLSEDEQLSAEELQMFESENAQLYNELNTLSDEVKQIESKVVRIAELQEIFAEKVLEQEIDIDRISLTVIGSTENVKDANEQIRQAIQRNAGLRAWVLFFLLVMSFTLLFLDWYND